MISSNEPNKAAADTSDADNATVSVPPCLWSPANTNNRSDLCINISQIQPGLWSLFRSHNSSQSQATASGGGSHERSSSRKQDEIQLCGGSGGQGDGNSDPTRDCPANPADPSSDDVAEQEPDQSLVPPNSPTTRAWEDPPLPPSRPTYGQAMEQIVAEALIALSCVEIASQSVQEAPEDEEQNRDRDRDRREQRRTATHAHPPLIQIPESDGDERGQVRDDEADGGSGSSSEDSLHIRDGGSDGAGGGALHGTGPGNRAAQGMDVSPSTATHGLAMARLTASQQHTSSTSWLRLARSRVPVRSPASVLARSHALSNRVRMSILEQRPDLCKQIMHKLLTALYENFYEYDGDNDENDDQHERTYPAEEPSTTYTHRLPEFQGTLEDCEERLFQLRRFTS